MEREPTQPIAAGPPGVPAEPGIRVASVEPRIFGVIPPALALSLGLGGVVGGVVAVGSGSAVAGAVLLLCGVVLVALAVDSARRWPTSALPRAAVWVTDTVGARLGVARVSTAAWAEAAREMIALRRELRALRREREAQQSALGEAAYRQDDGEVESLRERIAELDARIEGCERAIDEAAGRARTRVERKRAAVQPTESFAVVEEPPEDGAPRTEPTARRSA